jgi:hypothetical protein
MQRATVFFAERSPDADGLVTEQTQFKFEAGISDRTSLAQPSRDVTIVAIAEEPVRRVTLGQRFHAGAVSGNGVAQDVAGNRCECVQPSGCLHQPPTIAGGHRAPPISRATSLAGTTSPSRRRTGWRTPTRISRWTEDCGTPRSHAVCRRVR